MEMVVGTTLAFSFSTLGISGMFLVLRVTKCSTTSASCWSFIVWNMILFFVLVLRLEVFGKICTGPQAQICGPRSLRAVRVW